MAKLIDIINVRVDELRNRVVVKNIVLDGWESKNAKYIDPGEYEYFDQSWKVLNEGDIWARQGQTAFMRRTVTVPADWKGLRVALQMTTGGEGLLTLDGDPYHGVDDNRGYVLLSKSCNGNENYDCQIEIKTGGYFEYVVTDPIQPYILSKSRLLGIDTQVEQGYLDFKAIHDSARVTKDPVLQEAILKVMKEALHIIDFRDAYAPGFVESLEEARKVLWEKLAEIKFADNPGINFVAGHSHIDVAWLWPLRETARKVGRTYSTVTALMDEYPDYHFVCSQVPLFVFLKEHWPSVYERVKQRVAEGRFEPIGGTWVENDCNVVSGESLVRQCLYGKRFFRQEFGVDVRVGWLPDVFGYTWAMPQIYKQAGLDYFTTTKISWNDTNRFPHNTFWWQGIDGTKIFTHFVHGTYNAMVNPGEIQQFWDDYRSKLECPEFLSPYGFGDGGGGPTREMLESIPRLANVPGLPKVHSGSTHEFFDRIAENSKDLPVWNGEFYFELHRGTYTTQGRNKRFNRVSELTYRDAEMLSSIASLYGNVYEKQTLVEGWQTILLNHFHDIIPGSSINDVYKDSTKQYVKLIADAQDIKCGALKALAAKSDTTGEGQSVVVFNSLSWDRTGTVEVDWAGAENVVVIAPDNSKVPSQVKNGKLVFEATRVPSCGTAVYSVKECGCEKVSPFEVNGTQIKTPFYEMTLEADGTISRLKDLTNDREVIPEGARANVLQVFEDKPSNWEAWDVEVQYQDKVWQFEPVSPFKVIENGPARLVLAATFKYGTSTIEQKMVLYAGTPRVDFICDADWNERKTLLKVAFPVDIHTTRATYEIAFGAIERPNHWNTSWDKAQFEVSGHRWADLSEADYGVSLMNDCKYGWDVKDNVLRLSLLRGTESPDPKADLGKHEFTYSLFPHTGDWKNGTTQSGMELNIPLLATVEDKHEGTIGNSHSFLSIDKPNVIIDTVKQAEDSEDIIVRVYEAVGARGPVTLTFDREIAEAAETNLLEEDTAPANTCCCKIKFNIKPFELKTFRVKL